MNNEQRIKDEAALRVLYKLNVMIINGVWPHKFLLDLRTEDFLLACEMGSYGSVT